ncbi:Hypp1840 [Branchiostoma lanceolatum]|uniref:Hypp1840 protein n=1 Tax=Branchiostoma lanceolatum TaxID=7740 RepID=A0A8J9ZL52_BRALA|nr:Hypp1840 [Branchiostoma lanceolatum]
MHLRLCLQIPQTHFAVTPAPALGALARTIPQSSLPTPLGRTALQAWIAVRLPILWRMATSQVTAEVAPSLPPASVRWKTVPESVSSVVKETFV